MREAKRLLCFLLIFGLLFSTTPFIDIQSMRENNTITNIDFTESTNVEGVDSPPNVDAGQDETQNYAVDDETPYELGGSSSVVVNELMLYPSDGGPWVEFHNIGGQSISIDDWLLSDEDGLTYQFGNLPDIPPDSYVVVHFDHGESDSYFGQTQPNTFHIYTGWKNVRWTPHMVDETMHYIRVAVGHDVMSGGGMEILANKFGGDRIYFYEPQADITLPWIENNILGTGATHRIKPIDVDNDGFEDIVYDLYFGNEGGGAFSVHWMRAPATSPKDPWFGPYTIAMVRRPEGLDVGRINNDNFMDIVIGSKFNNEILWFESPPNPAGGVWTQHTIDGNFFQPGGMVLIDMDQDTDLDLIAVGSNGEEVAWFERPVDPTNPWTKHTIATPTGPLGPGTCSEFDATGELVVGYLDDDNDLDLVVSEADTGTIAWYNYDTNPTGTWNRYIVDDNISGPSGLDLGDVDGDGDLDIVAAATGGMIVWYPRPPIGELHNPIWPRYVVDSSRHLTFYANLTDLDGDGDLDIVTADQNDDKIIWYENEYLEFGTQDQVALYNSPVRIQDNIVDFVAYGGPALGEDSIAVAAGMWQLDEFVDMTGALVGHTLARDRYSTDNDLPDDWEHDCGIDSDIPTEGTVNYPNPTNLEVSMSFDPEFFSGGSPDGNPPTYIQPDLCLANYSAYTFSINVSNPFGWNDITSVELALDPNGTNIRFIWTQVDNNATVFGASDYLTLVSNENIGWTDGVYDWHLNFTIFFYWQYPSEGLQSIMVTSFNGHGYNDTDWHEDYFLIVKTLKLVDQISIHSLEKGELLSVGDWVKPDTQLEITGPKVIYNVQDSHYYPADSQFNVMLDDNRGNSWLDYTSAGFSVNFTINVPDDASTGPYILTMTLTDLPPGVSVLNNLTSNLNVDADPLQFDSPSPEGSIWHRTSSFDCGVRITDLMPGSEVDGETIEYRVANGSIDRFGEWTPLPLPGSGSSLEPSVICDFPDGAENWIQWRARDVAGNGPTVSPPYRVAVDRHGVTFHEFYPPSTLLHQQYSIHINITIADFGGSGININTIEAAVKSSGETDYGNWYAVAFSILNESTPTSTLVPSGPETVRISALVTGFKKGNDNYVKFRARDIAGNSYSESAEYNIRVDIQSSDQEDTGLKVEDLWWIIILIVFVIALSIVTVFNKKRDLSRKQEDESHKLSHSQKSSERMRERNI